MPADTPKYGGTKIDVLKAANRVNAVQPVIDEIKEKVKANKELEAAEKEQAAIEQKGTKAGTENAAARKQTAKATLELSEAIRQNTKSLGAESDALKANTELWVANARAREAASKVRYAPSAPPPPPTAAAPIYPTRPQEPPPRPTTAVPVPPPAPRPAPPTAAAVPAPEPIRTPAPATRAVAAETASATAVALGPIEAAAAQKLKLTANQMVTLLSQQILEGTARARTPGQQVTLQSLQKKGYVEEFEGLGYGLTAKGEKLQTIIDKHRALAQAAQSASTTEVTALEATTRAIDGQTAAYIRAAEALNVYQVAALKKGLSEGVIPSSKIGKVYGELEEKKLVYPTSVQANKTIPVDYVITPRGEQALNYIEQKKALHSAIDANIPAERVRAPAPIIEPAPPVQAPTPEVKPAAAPIIPPAEVQEPPPVVTPPPATQAPPPVVTPPAPVEVPAVVKGQPVVEPTPPVRVAPPIVEPPAPVPVPVSAQPIVEPTPPVEVPPPEVVPPTPVEVPATVKEKAVVEPASVQAPPPTVKPPAPVEVPVVVKEQAVVEPAPPVKVAPVPFKGDGLLAASLAKPPVEQSETEKALRELTSLGAVPKVQAGNVFAAAKEAAEKRYQQANALTHEQVEALYGEGVAPGHPPIYARSLVKKGLLEETPAIGPVPGDYKITEEGQKLRDLYTKTGLPPSVHSYGTSPAEFEKLKKAREEFAQRLKAALGLEEETAAATAAAQAATSSLPRSRPAVYDYSQTKLTPGKFAGGSNDARFAEDAAGTQFLIKQYGGDIDRISSELLGNSIYRELGISTPKGGLTQVEGKPALAYPLEEGAPQKITAPIRGIQQGLAADALIANWDVFGFEHNPVHENVLFGPGGEPIRIDQGGTFTYKGMEGNKPFGPVPVDLKSLQDFNAEKYGEIPESRLKEQAGQIAQKLPPERVHEIVSSLPFEDKNLQKQLEENLNRRILAYKQFAEGTITYDQLVTTGAVRTSEVQVQASTKAATAAEIEAAKISAAQKKLIASYNLSYAERARLLGEDTGKVVGESGYGTTIPLRSRERVVEKGLAPGKYGSSLTPAGETLRAALLAQRQEVETSDLIAEEALARKVDPRFEAAGRETPLAKRFHKIDQVRVVTGNQTPSKVRQGLKSEGFHSDSLEELHELTTPEEIAATRKYVEERSRALLELEGIIDKQGRATIYRAGPLGKTNEEHVVSGFSTRPLPAFESPPRGPAERYVVPANAIRAYSPAVPKIVDEYPEEQEVDAHVRTAQKAQREAFLKAFDAQAAIRYRELTAIEGEQIQNLSPAAVLTNLLGTKHTNTSNPLRTTEAVARELEDAELAQIVDRDQKTGAPYIKSTAQGQAVANRLREERFLGFRPHPEYGGSSTATEGIYAKPISREQQELLDRLGTETVTTKIGEPIPAGGISGLTDEEIAKAIYKKQAITEEQKKLIAQAGLKGKESNLLRTGGFVGSDLEKTEAYQRLESKGLITPLGAHTPKGSALKEALEAHIKATGIYSEADATGYAQELKLKGTAVIPDAQKKLIADAYLTGTHALVLKGKIPDYLSQSDIKESSKGLQDKGLFTALNATTKKGDELREALNAHFEQVGAYSILTAKDYEKELEEAARQVSAKTGSYTTAHRKLIVKHGLYSTEAEHLTGEYLNGQTVHPDEYEAEQKALKEKGLLTPEGIRTEEGLKLTEAIRASQGKYPSYGYATVTAAQSELAKAGEQVDKKLSEKEQALLEKHAISLGHAETLLGQHGAPHGEDIIALEDKGLLQAPRVGKGPPELGGRVYTHEGAEVAEALQSESKNPYSVYHGIAESGKPISPEVKAAFTKAMNETGAALATGQQELLNAQAKAAAALGYQLTAPQIALIARGTPGAGAAGQLIEGHPGLFDVGGLAAVESFKTGEGLSQAGKDLRAALRKVEAEVPTFVPTPTPKPLPAISAKEAEELNAATATTVRADRAVVSSTTEAAVATEASVKRQITARDLEAAVAGVNAEKVAAADAAAGGGGRIPPQPPKTAHFSEEPGGYDPFTGQPKRDLREEPPKPPVPYRPVTTVYERPGPASYTPGYGPVPGPGVPSSRQAREIPGYGIPREQLELARSGVPSEHGPIVAGTRGGEAIVAKPGSELVRNIDGEVASIGQYTEAEAKRAQIIEQASGLEAKTANETARAGAAYRRAAAELAAYSTSLQRHGALSTEFIAALSRGEVTLSEFGDAVVATIGKFGGWALAGAAVYGTYEALKRVVEGAKAAASSVTQLERIGLPNFSRPRAEQELLGVSRRVNVPVSEAGNAAFYAGRAGFHTQRQAVEVGETALIAEKLDQISVQDSTKAFGALRSAYGLTGSGIREVFNVLDVGQREFNARLQQTLPYVGRAAAAFKAAGGTALQLAQQTIEVTGAVGGGGGTGGGSAATFFTREAGNLRKRSSEEILRAYGFDPRQKIGDLNEELQNAAARGRSPNGRVFDLAARQRAAEGAGGGPAVGGRFALQLIEAGASGRATEVRERANYKTAAGSVSQELGKQLDRFDEEAAKIGHTFERLGVELGKAGFTTAAEDTVSSFGFLGGVIEKLTEPVGALGEKFNELGPGIQTALLAIGALAVASKVAGSSRAQGAVKPLGEALGHLPLVGGPAEGYINSPQRELVRAAKRTFSEQEDELNRRVQDVSKAQFGNTLELDKALAQKTKLNAAAARFPEGDVSKEATAVAKQRLATQQRIEALEAKQVALEEEAVFLQSKINDTKGLRGIATSNASAKQIASQLQSRGAILASGKVVLGPTGPVGAAVEASRREGVPAVREGEPVPAVRPIGQYTAPIGPLTQREAEAAAYKTNAERIALGGAEMQEALRNIARALTGDGEALQLAGEELRVGLANLATGTLGAGATGLRGLGKVGIGGKLLSAGFGAYAGIAGAEILGGAIGGRKGQAVEGIGTDVAIGAAIGSVLPLGPVTTIGGGVLGGAIGLVEQATAAESHEEKVIKQRKRLEAERLKEGTNANIAQIEGASLELGAEIEASVKDESEAAVKAKEKVSKQIKAFSAIVGLTGGKGAEGETASKAIAGAYGHTYEAQFTASAQNTAAAVQSAEEALQAVEKGVEVNLKRALPLTVPGSAQRKEALASAHAAFKEARRAQAGVAYGAQGQLTTEEDKLVKEETELHNLEAKGRKVNEGYGLSPAELTEAAKNYARYHSTLTESVPKRAKRVSELREHSENADAALGATQRDLVAAEQSSYVAPLQGELAALNKAPASAHEKQTGLKEVQQALDVVRGNQRKRVGEVANELKAAEAQKERLTEYLPYDAGKKTTLGPNLQRVEANIEKLAGALKVLKAQQPGIERALKLLKEEATFETFQSELSLSDTQTQIETFRAKGDRKKEKEARERGIDRTNKKVAEFRRKNPDSKELPKAELEGLKAQQENNKAHIEEIEKEGEITVSRIPSYQRVKKAQAQAAIAERVAAEMKKAEKEGKATWSEVADAVSKANDARFAAQEAIESETEGLIKSKGALEQAQDQGDQVKVAQDQINEAKKLIAVAKTREAKENAEADLKNKEFAKHRAEVAKQEAIGSRETARYQGNPVKAAEITVANAKKAVASAKGEEEKIQAEQKLFDAENALHQARQHRIQTLGALRESDTRNPIRRDEIKIHTDRELLASTKGRPEEHAELQRTLNEDITKAHEDKINEKEKNIDYLLNTEQVSDQVAAGKYQRILAKLQKEHAAPDAIRSVKEKIFQLLNKQTQDFEVGSVLQQPTLYDALTLTKTKGVPTPISGLPHVPNANDTHKPEPSRTEPHREHRTPDREHATAHIAVPHFEQHNNIYIDVHGAGKPKEVAEHVAHHLGKALDTHTRAAIRSAGLGRR